MRKSIYIFIILSIVFCSCKKKTNNDEVSVTPIIDAKVTQFSCTDFYYYWINFSSAISTEVDFGDGSPIIALSSNTGYHQYVNTGSFNLKFKQTFSDGQIIEKTFPINIPQLCKYKRILSTNLRAGIPSDVESFEFAGNVYFNYNPNNGYRSVYNIASNRFFKTYNSGNIVSDIFDGTYLYEFLNVGAFTPVQIRKGIFDSIPNPNGLTQIPIQTNIPQRYWNLQIVANGKIYYGLGEIYGSSTIYNNLYAIDCITGAVTIITTPFGNSNDYLVGGQAYYNGKIYIFCGNFVIVFDPVANTFNSFYTNSGGNMFGPSGSSGKTKVINNYAFMRSSNDNIIVYDFNTNTYLNNCELSNMKGLNFVANNKYYTLCPDYYLNRYVFQNSDELWEYQP